MPLADSTILMILPAMLVLVGMLTGYCFWGWLRSVDQSTVDDLHDEIRSLGRQIERNSSATSDIQDLHFENQELRSQFESREQRWQQSDMQVQELRSTIEVRAAELQMAESTILSLRKQISQLEESQSKDQAMVGEELRSKTFQMKVPAATSLANTSETVESNYVEPTEMRSKPMILRLAPTKKLAAKKQIDLDTEYGGEVFGDENLGLVYSRPPMFNDNLQLISGIASKLENQLNDYGVYTFQQIMLWSKHNIDQFSSLLDTFQDRIQRDDWVGQAEALYNKARKMRSAA